MNRPSGARKFLAELKRRNVVRVALVYLAVAYAVTEAADIILPRLAVPDWSITLIVVLVALGFPIALVLAWALEISPDGVRVTDPVSTGELLAPAAAAEHDGGDGARGGGGWLSARALVATVVMLGLGVGMGWLARGGGATAPAARVAAADATPSIAVLPFTDMSPEGDQAYFGDGVAEEILNALAKIDGLRVAARTSTFKLRDQDIATVGERLNVGSVLEGSVRKQGNQVRVTAQLISVEDGFHLWSQTFDRQLDNIFAVQDEISRSIARALQIELTGEDDVELSQRGTVAVEAYNHYLRGRYHWNKRTKAGLELAAAEFRAAIAIDSTYALAYSGLADAYSIQAGWSYEPAHEVMPLAKAAALEALDLDETLAAGHRSLALVLAFYDRDWDEAEAAYRKALALDPNDGFARYWYSILLDDLDRGDEAERQVVQARELDPLAPQIGAGVGVHFIVAGDYRRAIEELLKVREFTPDFVGAQFHLARAYIFAAEHEKALSEIERYQGRLPGRAAAFRALALSGLGRGSEAEHWVAEAEAYADTAFLDPLSLVQMYAGLGRVDEAFDVVNEAFDARSTILVYFSGQPYLDFLGNDPRYAALLRRIGLER